MTECLICGKEFTYAELPFKCKYCDEHFCIEHQLPENHKCNELERLKKGEKVKLKKQPLGREYELHDIEFKKEPGRPFIPSFSPLPKKNTPRDMLIMITVIFALIITYVFLNREEVKNRLPVSFDLPNILLMESPPNINITQLEHHVYDLTNEEREKNNLKPMKWNDDIANVVRKHSQYLANLNYGFTESLIIDHEDQYGQYHDDRLEKNGIYYFGSSAENIHSSSVVESYYVDEQHTPANYWTQEEMAENAIQGWMNSPGHRENILTPNFDETGIGIATDPTETNYVFTQVFIERIYCGYKGAECCPGDPGYLDWCYIPYECVSGVCE